MQIPSWLSRIIQPKRAAARRFDAAQYNRLTHSWRMAERSINTELRNDLDALRRRSRDLSKNEPLAVKYLKMVRKNVAGPNGFNFQARVVDEGGKPDAWANKAIEAAYYDWSRPANCDITGRLSFAGITQGISMALARDGEVLIKLIDNAPNQYGFALQWLDIERLDTTFNREPAPGQNQVIMGVELDENGTPVAYWMATSAIGKDPTGRSLQRMSADNMLHLFMTDDPEQVRGIPWMHASMIRIHHLKGFQEAAIVAARIGASKMGFFVNPDGTAPAMDAGAMSDGEDSSGIPFTEADPGQFGIAPPGYRFESFDPDYPHGNYDPFVKAAKRDIGSGMDVAYHALGNDLEGVNFSSIRSGVLDERDSWMLIQRWMVDHFLTVVFLRWLDCALLKRAIVMQNGSPLPASKRAKFSAHEFQGRRWPWVDPLKDAMASVLLIKNRLADPYTIAAQQGVDLDDVLDGIARFEATAASKNVTLYIDDADAMLAVSEELGEDSLKPKDKPVKDKKLEENNALLDRMSRLEDRQSAPIVINNSPPSVTLNQGDIHMPEQKSANITVRAEPAPTIVNVAAPIVNVAAPEVTVSAPEVSFEAIMPSQSDIRIISMPERETSTVIRRDTNGNIVDSSQIERDSK